MNEGYEEMMHKLQQHIGEEITYEGWLYGIKQEGNTILKEVYPYICIDTDAMMAPFIGYGCAIKKITLTKTGEILFYNPIIEDNYDRKDPKDISSAELQFLSCQNMIHEKKKVNAR